MARRDDSPDFIEAIARGLDVIRAFGAVVLVTAALLINTFVAAPNEALKGVAVLLAGLPLYWYWSRKNPITPAA